MSDDYLEINRANWDSRAPIHVRHYGIEALLADPNALSDVVRFDLPRLGRLDGLEVLHLQCHIGTDTLSLARLGAASVTGLDLSPISLAEARKLAATAGTSIDYVESDTYSAVSALGRTFDLVYTGIGAICWLPSIQRWAQTVAALLRPGGRLFIRDGHPVLNTVFALEVANEHPDRAQQPWITGPGQTTVAIELPYYERSEALVWHDELTYAGKETVASPTTMEWNHSIGEIVTAVLDAGLQLTSLTEHDSVPWEALPGYMDFDENSGEWRLSERPERLPASFTLTAAKPA
ncbi:MAG: class I SAM-dependent methyltransferase [Propionicimonas sp.]|uniref:class I SAM-dependent methyltransferase n=1 Tax=Propionicimonas sp. TaxID=1955623 RepID=UPI001D3C0407|nr:class I SAM-dependent methyltransferase [Propionicimonas sp.]MBU4249378.1 class I SAM-dependent methyltransferase [Actinomycetota bacterium]MBU4364727.1 class I SAM-dependent methyltransferase [Actinomycetota bacterium]MCG2803828.1 class I SAM-dependent methyltransferase [Propionicimonas sp.]